MGQGGPVTATSHTATPRIATSQTAAAEKVAAPAVDVLTVGALTAEDLPDILNIDASAFGQDPPQDFMEELVVPWLELDRFVGARDAAAGGELVASGCILSKSMTFPGGGVQPVAGVSWVGVRPGWRRRGLLRGLMTAQLHGLHDTAGEPIAILTASEGSLYGRFGYGQAIPRSRFSIVHGAAFRRGVSVEPVLEIRTEDAPAIVKPLYARVAATRTGNLARPDELWRMRFSDHQELRDGASKRRFAVHPDGYVSYRLKGDWGDHGPDYTLLLDEICAATPSAFASLWRFLLDLDLTRKITYNMGWVDDPLLTLLEDPRGVVDTVRDHVWLRLVDLDRAIGLRSYSAPASLVVDVTDTFCPWNQGRWLFDLDPAGGTVQRTDARAQVALDIRDLGACFLGGTPLGRLVAAGVVTGDPDALLTLGAALSTPVAPWCPEGF
jgi:predicted acetyltransferase